MTNFRLLFLLLAFTSFNAFCNQDSTLTSNRAFGSIEIGGSIMGKKLNGIHIGFSRVKKSALFIDYSGGFINNSIQSMNINLLIGKPFIIKNQSYFAVATGVGIITRPGAFNNTGGTPALPFSFRLHYTSNYIGVGAKANFYLPIWKTSSDLYLFSAYLSIPIRF